MHSLVNLFHQRQRAFGPRLLVAHCHLSGKKMESFLYILLIFTVTRSKSLPVYKYAYFPAPLNKAAYGIPCKSASRKHPCDAKWTDGPTDNRALPPFPAGLSTRSRRVSGSGSSSEPRISVGHCPERATTGKRKNMPRLDTKANQRFL